MRTKLQVCMAHMHTHTRRCTTACVAGVGSHDCGSVFARLGRVTTCTFGSRCVTRDGMRTFSRAQHSGHHLMRILVPLPTRNHDSQHTIHPSLLLCHAGAPARRLPAHPGPGRLQVLQVHGFSRKLGRRVEGPAEGFLRGEAQGEECHVLLRAHGKTAGLRHTAQPLPHQAPSTARNTALAGSWRVRVCVWLYCVCRA
jgi:hypothetical protein